MTTSKAFLPPGQLTGQGMIDLMELYQANKNNEANAPVFGGANFGLNPPADTYRQRNRSIQVAGTLRKKSESFSQAARNAIGLQYAGQRFHVPSKNFNDMTSPTRAGPFSQQTTQISPHYKDSFRKARHSLGAPHNMAMSPNNGLKAVNLQRQLPQQFLMNARAMSDSRSPLRTIQVHILNKQIRGADLKNLFVLNSGHSTDPNGPTQTVTPKQMRHVNPSDAIEQMYLEDGINAQLNRTYNQIQSPSSLQLALNQDYLNVSHYVNSQVNEFAQSGGMNNMAHVSKLNLQFEPPQKPLDQNTRLTHEQDFVKNLCNNRQSKSFLDTGAQIQESQKRLLKTVTDKSMFGSPKQSLVLESANKKSKMHLGSRSPQGASPNQDSQVMLQTHGNFSNNYQHLYQNKNFKTRKSFHRNVYLNDSQLKASLTPNGPAGTYKIANSQRKDFSKINLNKGWTIGKTQNHSKQTSGTVSPKVVKSKKSNQSKVQLGLTNINVPSTEMIGISHRIADPNEQHVASKKKLRIQGLTSRSQFNKSGLEITEMDVAPGKLGSNEISGHNTTRAQDSQRQIMFGRKGLNMDSVSVLHAQNLDLKNEVPSRQRPKLGVTSRDIIGDGHNSSEEGSIISKDSNPHEDDDYSNDGIASKMRAIQGDGSVTVAKRKQSNESASSRMDDIMGLTNTTFNQTNLSMMGRTTVRFGHSFGKTMNNHQAQNGRHSPITPLTNVKVHKHVGNLRDGESEERSENEALNQPLNIQISKKKFPVIKGKEVQFKPILGCDKTQRKFERFQLPVQKQMGSSIMNRMDSNLSIKIMNVTFQSRPGVKGNTSPGNLGTSPSPHGGFASRDAGQKGQYLKHQTSKRKKIVADRIVGGKIMRVPYNDELDSTQNLKQRLRRNSSRRKHKHRKNSNPSLSKSPSGDTTPRVQNGALTQTLGKSSTRNLQTLRSLSKNKISNSSITKQSFGNLQLVQIQGSNEQPPFELGAGAMLHISSQESLGAGIHTQPVPFIERNYKQHNQQPDVNKDLQVVQTNEQNLTNILTGSFYGDNPMNVTMTSQMKQGQNRRKKSKGNHSPKASERSVNDSLEIHGFEAKIGSRNQLSKANLLGMQASREKISQNQPIVVQETPLPEPFTENRSTKMSNTHQVGGQNQMLQSIAQPMRGTLRKVGQTDSDHNVTQPIESDVMVGMQATLFKHVTSSVKAPQITTANANVNVSFTNVGLSSTNQDIQTKVAPLSSTNNIRIDDSDGHASIDERDEKNRSDSKIKVITRLTSHGQDFNKTTPKNQGKYFQMAQKDLPSYMQPQKRPEPIQLTSQHSIYKKDTSLVSQLDLDDESINNNPLSGVRGVNIERSHLLAAAKEAVSPSRLKAEARNLANASSISRKNDAKGNENLNLDVEPWENNGQLNTAMMQQKSPITSGRQSSKAQNANKDISSDDEGPRERNLSYEEEEKHQETAQQSQGEDKSPPQSKKEGKKEHLRAKKSENPVMTEHLAPPSTGRSKK